MKAGRLQPIRRAVLDEPLWMYACVPVRVRNIWLRALAFGLFFTVTVTVPFLVVTYFILRGNDVRVGGHIYCFFKAGFAVFLTWFIYPANFVAATAEEDDKVEESMQSMLESASWHVET